MSKSKSNHQREDWRGYSKRIMGSSSLFPTEDKLREKADYPGWKMSIDLTLEDQGVLDHVRGNIVEPLSNASASARNKWKTGEVKAKKII